MQIETLRFGEIEVEPESVLTFPEGVWGFPEARRFCLVPYVAGTCGATPGGSCAEGARVVRWLQSLDDPTLAFLTINPLEFFPEYELVLSDGEKAALGLRGPEEAALLAFLTVSRECGAVTANLAGPVVINTRTRQARQVVVDDSRYVTRHLVGGMAKAETER